MDIEGLPPLQTFDFDADLSPCPFCAGKAEFNYTDWDEETQTGDDGTGWVECSGCGVEMYGATRDDAVRKWNLRVPAVPAAPGQQVALTADYVRAVREEIEQELEKADADLATIGPYLFDDIVRTALARHLVIERPSLPAGS